MATHQQIRNLLRDTKPNDPESLMRFAKEGPAIIEQLLGEAGTALNKGTELAMSIAEGVIEGICRYGELKEAWRTMEQRHREIVVQHIIAIVLERMSRGK